MFLRAKDGIGVYGVKLYDFSRPTGHELVPDREAAIDPFFELDGDNNLGKYSNHSVAIFALDCRTNKTPWGILSDPNGDFLVALRSFLLFPFLTSVTTVAISVCALFSLSRKLQKIGRSSQKLKIDYII
mmetsp:Transcript_39913/g.93691  ORF Transcript_39913/g.93691 Transcript_39913/m.93691 type:complete len:129 (+) Transcript_39913:442-828(+)